MNFIRNILDAVSNNLISGDAYYIILKGIVVTIVITLIAWIVAGGLGILISYFMAYDKKIVSGIFRAISFLLRSTPVLLLLLLLKYVVLKQSHMNLMILAGIGIGLYGAGHLSEVITNKVNESKRTQDELVIKKLRHVYFTVTAPQMVEDTIYQWKRLFIQLFHWTTVVGYITVNDLTRVMIRIGQRTMYPFFSIAFCILFHLVTIAIIEMIFCWLEKKIKNH